MDLENKKKTVRKHMFMSVALAALAPAGLLTATSVVAPAAAQDYTSGALAGTVVDQAGNPVAGATVTITSSALGFSRSVATSASGGFRFGALPGGSYDISVSSSAGSTSESGVGVAASSTTNYTFVVGQSTGDNVVVTGTRQNLDFSNTTTGLNLDVESLVKEIPVGRDLTSLTLLAPGVSLGDSAFGNLSSIGGSSIAENSYYVNGLNLTNFDNFIGSSLVPFDMYKSVEVKTGGYPAEFGRATGGVVNAVTKSGTNEWRAAFHMNWEPDSLRSDSPDTYAAANHLDERRNFDTILELGGPIIKDRLFVYGLAEFNDDRTADASYLTGAQNVDKLDDPFWGVKIDAYPIDNHHLEFTYFDTARTTRRTVYDYDDTTDTIGSELSRTNFVNGGESFVGKYTGTFTEWLTISAAYGKNKDQNETLPSSTLNRVIDSRTGAGGADLSAQTTTSVTTPRTTSREFYRADVDLYFDLMGDHHVRVGFDKEKLDFARVSVRTGQDGIDAGGQAAAPGGLTYIYRTCGAATAVCTGGAPALVMGDEYVELNYYNSGGAFYAENTAYYFQDEWNVTDQLTLNLGVRWDQFANFTADGTQFIDFDKELAPRVGFSYDVFGDGRTKLYGNFGVYYLPVASNTAYRQGGREWYFREYYTFTGIGANGLPMLDQQILDWTGGNDCPFGLIAGSAGAGSASCNVTGDGSVQNPLSSISRNLEATKEKEIIVGFEHHLSDLLTVGVNYTHRNLATTAEDAAIDAAVIAYCNDAANMVNQTTTSCSSIWTGYHQYTIINPGSDSTIVLRDLLPGETELRTVEFSAADLGYPKAKRSYDAVEFTFQRAFDGVWSLRGSYVWSKSKGNSEGGVQSDFSQTDTGVTQDFDQPGFTDNSYGYLPNHRAHRVRLFGSYQVMEDLLIGANVLIDSPRKFSCFGFNPTNSYNNFENGYGAGSHYCGGVAAPRGEGLEGDWTFDASTSVRYNIELPTGSMMTLRADVFNIFNGDSVLRVDEIGEDAVLTPRPQYGSPLGYQNPRRVRLGLDIEF